MARKPQNIKATATSDTTASGAAEMDHKEWGVLNGTDAYDTHVLIKRDGTENTSPMAGKPYATINWSQIVAMAENPPSIENKKMAPFIICSSYVECDGREHAAQRERGRFWIMPVDVDANGYSYDQVEAALLSALGGEYEMLIYSTRSSTVEKPKWRALVPLASPVEGRLWSTLMKRFFDRLAAGGIKVDRVLCRTGQVAFLPNAGDHYDGGILSGDRFDPTEWIAEAEAIEAEFEAKRVEALEAVRANPIKRAGVIGAWCALHPLEEMMDACGYVHAGGRSSDWRSPLQQSASFATRTYREGGREFWISLSQSDFEAGLGRHTRDDHCFGDAFDIWVHFKNGGDRDKAMKAARSELTRRRQRALAKGLADGLGALKADTMIALRQPGGGEYNDPAPAREVEQFLSWVSDHWRNVGVVYEAKVTRPAGDVPANVWIDTAGRLMVHDIEADAIYPATFAPAGVRVWVEAARDHGERDLRENAAMGAARAAGWRGTPEEAAMTVLRALAKWLEDPAWSATEEVMLSVLTSEYRVAVAHGTGANNETGADREADADSGEKSNA